MRFNSAFKGLILTKISKVRIYYYNITSFCKTETKKRENI
jgi:hypothetical protein